MSKSLWIGITADSLAVSGPGPVVKESMDLGGYVPLDGLHFEAIIADGELAGYGVIAELSAPERTSSAELGRMMTHYAPVMARVRGTLSTYGLTGPVSVNVQEIDLPISRATTAYVH
jgi:hypothetical protein